MEFYIGVESKEGGVLTSAPLNSTAFKDTYELREYLESLVETYPEGELFIRVR